MNRERGATVVEYALAVAVVVVLCLGALQVLEDESEDRLSDRGDVAGAPLDESFRGLGESAGSPGGGGGGGGGTPGPTGIRLGSLVGGFQQGFPDVAKWDAVVTVTFTDNGGVPLAGVTVNGTWSPSGHGSGGLSCVTDAAGTCQLVRVAINDNRKTVTFSLGTVTNGTLTYVSQEADPSGATITCANPVC